MQVIELLARRVLSKSLLSKIYREAKYVSLEFTGCGYFFTVSHPDLPARRIVCHEPEVWGIADGVKSGFIIFIENGELTIECYDAEDKNVLLGYRDQDVIISSSEEV